MMMNWMIIGGAIFATFISLQMEHIVPTAMFALQGTIITACGWAYALGRET
jgi:hypothetical protein